MTALLRPALGWLRSLLSGRGAARGNSPTTRLGLEELESRALPSAAAPPAVSPDFQITPLTAAAAAPYSPWQIRSAYGFSRLPYDGTGQTIAIVDAYDDPNIQTDLATFDRTFGLAGPPSFVKATPQGAPAVDPDWAGEISLDVEWAHAIAPKAKILLVEAASATDASLASAVNYARNQPGVVAVSMSWGGGEFSTEAAYDSIFTTPSGHGGVVFVAASGDGGKGVEWPSVSPNVLAVGGSSLTITTQGVWFGETGWSGSGGGLSAFEAEPAFQKAVQSSGKRSTPDVAYNADPNTGYYVYDTVPDLNGDKGWFAYGGTSAGAPQWAALIALADQGRAAAGLGALANGPSVIYTLSAGDFHDVTAGSNGYQAGAHYDMVTGLGSPRADLVVADLVKYGAASSSAKSTGAKPGATTSRPQSAVKSAAEKPTVGPGRTNEDQPEDNGADL